MFLVISKTLFRWLLTSRYACVLSRDMRQNKGTILKASCDYIKRLKKDQDRMRMMEEHQKQLESTNRKMLLKIQVIIQLMYLLVTRRLHVSLLEAY